MSVLHWTYLPKTRRSSQSLFSTKLISDRTSVLYRRRKARRRDIARFNKIVLGLFMIVFAMELGRYMWSTLMSENALIATESGVGITLPKAEGYRNIPKRLVFLVTITKDGVVLFEGKEVERAGWGPYLFRIKNERPLVILQILADKEVEMSVVQDFLFKARQVGVYRISFGTSKRDDQYL